MITIVQLSPVQLSQHETMHHVTKEIGLLLEARSLNRDVGKSLLGENVHSVIDTLGLDASPHVSSTTDVIKRFLK